MEKAAPNNYTIYIHIFPNGKVYIGQTKQALEDRWSKGVGYRGQMVGRAIKKYGWDNIEHVVIETGLSKEEANKLEIKLIADYQSNDHVHGYNVSLGGSSVRKNLHNSEEHNRRIAESHKKRVSCYTKSGELLGTFGSIMAAAEFCKGSFRTISACCNGTKKSGYGYIWRFEHDAFNKYETKNRIGGVKGFPVIAKTIEGAFVGEYKSMHDASLALKIREDVIAQICRGKRAHKQGLVFHFKRR